MQNLQEFKRIETRKIPEDWKFLHLKEIVKINPESIDRNYPYDEIEYIDIGSVENYDIKKYEHFKLFERPSRAQRIVKQNDIIVSTVRPYLHGFAKIRHSKPNLVCSTGFAVLRSNNANDVDFMFNFIMSEYFESQLNSHMTGLAYPAVTSKIVGDTILCYPKNNNEVKRIGNILSKVDELIQKTDQIIEQTQRLKKGLMQRLLTKGIGHSKFKKEVAAFSLFKKNIPITWKISKLNQLSKVVRGGSPRPAGDPKYFGGKIPWITVGDLTKDNQMYLNSVDKGLTEEGKARSRYLEKGTVILANSGATLGIPKILNIAGCINDGVAAFLDLKNELLQEYLYYVLFSWTHNFRNINQGMGQPNLNTEIIGNLYLSLPPMNEQRQIVLIISNIDNNIEKNEKTFLHLQNLKRGLMQQLLTGKIRVKV